MVRLQGGSFGKVYIVGCEPAGIEEGIGLSEPVSRAVEIAVQMILDIVRRDPGSNHEATS
jgi:hydrogenase maturation protease